MNKKIIDALTCIENLHLKGVVLAIPFAIGFKEFLFLREHPLCKGLVLLNPSSEIINISNNKCLGCFEDHGWRLPIQRAPIFFIGPQLMVTRKMAIQTLKTLRFSIICKVNGNFIKFSTLRFFLWQLGEIFLQNIRQYPESHPIRKVVTYIKQVPVFRIFWRRVFKREDFSNDSQKKKNIDDSRLAEEVLYKELLHRAQSSEHSKSYQAIPRRVLLVNAGLAAGGAERQIVNTLIGLKNSGRCESVALLAEYISHAPCLDFFLHDLEIAGVEVSQVKNYISLSEDGLSSIQPDVAELLAEIAPNIIEEILNLVDEFRSRKPEVVHAWQDASSIKAGIAAVIAGVPRIVLASRNVTPMNFTYFQDYMYPAYKALASMESVLFVNNSEAGAADYTSWLGLSKERFTVVRNGVDLRYLKRADKKTIDQYRQSIGIPESAKVVGTILRFWAEKRPILWLQTAAIIAKRYPDVHFLMIGEGPMRQEMEAFLVNNELKDRVHLPGACKEIATPLSAIDIFVLTSQFEGTPNVLLEAQWLGLPVVATNAGGTIESFEPNVTGLLAVSADAEQIALLVDEYLANKIKLEKIAILGPSFVERIFSSTRMIEETLEIYRFRDLKPILAEPKH